MEWQVIVALIVTIPIIILPVAFVWYLNVGGIYAAVKEARAKRAAHAAEAKAMTTAQDQEIETYPPADG